MSGESKNKDSDWKRPVLTVQIIVDVILWIAGKYHLFAYKTTFQCSKHN
jgi:hypothetical protein